MAIKHVLHDQVQPGCFATWPTCKLGLDSARPTM